MRNILVALTVTAFLFASCDEMFHETIQGNGKASSEQRTISAAQNVHLRGSFDAEITPGNGPSIKIEADENLLPYIVTRNEGNTLIIETKDHVDLKSDNKIKVYITTDKLEDIDVAGSGDVKGMGKFNGGDHLKLSIAGSGSISIEVNTPSIDAHIAGSGDIILAGETQDSKIDIAGDGNYKASDLKAEDVKISIAGSGDAHVFASAKLKVDVAGSGNIFYKGSPNIEQHFAGGGEVKHEE